MTTAEEELQSLAAASFGAWMQVTNAWMDAANRVWSAVAEWAYDEVLLDAAFTGDAVASAPRDTALRPVLVHVYSGAELPVEVVTVTPAAVRKDAPTVVSVRIAHDKAVPTGVYHGHLADDRGQPVSNELNVTVLCG